MTLTLDGEEWDLLREILTNHLDDLKVEIHRTEHHKFREKLERHQQLLEALLARLGRERPTGLDRVAS
jgi:hypothetical protein